MPQGVIQGTVPYLGTFLTDLVMLDTAMKDYLYVSELSLRGLKSGARGLGDRAPCRPLSSGSQESLEVAPLETFQSSDSRTEGWPG